MTIAQLNSELKKLEKIIGRKFTRPEIAALFGMNSVTSAINKMRGKSPINRKDEIVLSKYILLSENHEKFKALFESEIVPAAKELSDKRYSYIKKYRDSKK